MGFLLRPSDVHLIEALLPDLSGSRQGLCSRPTLLQSRVQLLHTLFCCHPLLCLPFHLLFHPSPSPQLPPQLLVLLLPLLLLYPSLFSFFLHLPVQPLSLLLPCSFPLLQLRLQLSHRLDLSLQLLLPSPLLSLHLTLPLL